MKIESLTIKDDNLEASFKTAVVATLIGYGKMYELLHKQLWRKNRITLADYSLVVNDRVAKPILYYNIKSWSTEPYSYDGFMRDDGQFDDTLGLNQLFAGQDPYNAYDGDPSDGIYHDTCQIVPKSEELDTALDSVGWHVEGNGTWHKYDEWGNVVISDVSAPFQKPEYDEFYWITITNNNGYSYDRILRDYETEDNDGNPIVTEAKDLTTEVVNFSNGYDARFPQEPKVISIPDLTAEHGEVVREIIHDAVIKPPLEGITWFNAPTSISSKILIYTDGTCIQFTQPSMWDSGYDGSSEIHQTNGYKTYLPLVYIDTGDLVQNRVDFIDNWDDEFELNVEEDSYWYTPLISIAVIVVSIVIAVLSAGWAVGWEAGWLTAEATTLAAIGGALAGIGSVSGDKVLQIVGTILSLGVNIETLGAKQIAKTALLEHLPTLSATAVLENTSFIELFQGFVSGAGFSNLLSVGSSVFSIYNTATTPSMQSVTASTEPAEDTGMKVMIDDSNEDKTINYIYDVLKV